MRIVHLTASTFFGGPERQMIGLTRQLPSHCRSSFLLFSESGRAQEFYKNLRWNGFDADILRRDTPNLPAAALELTLRLRRLRADVLLCHGYKANVVGRLAARQVGIPAIAVSRGWTGENSKVRIYETIDRLHLRYMDRVVCVSHGQAQKVRRAGVPPFKIDVIPNAARLYDGRTANPDGRATLESFFDPPGESVVVAAGRLSPEKGVPVLIEAARRVIDAGFEARFVVFGEGTQRPKLERMIAEADLKGLFALPGFRSDLDQLMPSADLFVLPSFTEGLPNVVLEASAAAVAVVATAVGGTPEVVDNGTTGLLVAAGDSAAMAARIQELLKDEPRRRRMGEAGRQFVRRHFTFEAQAAAYLKLFEKLNVRDRATGIAA
jgi:glycosyltransferase involved in cell wall biosynthesis